MVSTLLVILFVRWVRFPSTTIIEAFCTPEQIIVTCNEAENKSYSVWCNSYQIPDGSQWKPGKRLARKANGEWDVGFRLPTDTPPARPFFYTARQL